MQDIDTMNLREIRNTVVQIQLANSKILAAIDTLLCVGGCAEILPDNPEDIDGKELSVGDRVVFTVAGTDSTYELEGTVTLEGETYCINTGDNLFILDDDILELKLLEWDE